MPPSIYACLDVSGTFDPADVTRMLGVEASAHRAGELRRNGKHWDQDSWHFSTAKEESWEWPEHLDSVLALIQPCSDDFVRFCDDRALEREVHLIAEMTGETPIGSFSVEQVADLARFGCSLDIDLYCWTEADEAED